MTHPDFHSSKATVRDARVAGATCFAVASLVGDTDPTMISTHQRHMLPKRPIIGFGHRERIA